MPTVFSHALVGLAAADAVVPRGRSHPRLLFTAAVLAVVPDLDGLFMYWVPYGAPWGHRGASHSIAFALLLAVVGSLYPFRREGILGGRWSRTVLLLWAVTASHGILDAFTDGGLGIAFFAPFRHDRYFFPVEAIPVSPIGRAFFSAAGLSVLAAEIWLLWLFCAAAAVAKRATGMGGWLAAGLLTVAGAVGWIWRCMAS